MYPFKRTKILATVGPAVNTKEKISQLISSGVNGLRLNFSHGNHEERLAQIDWIRQASAEIDRSVAILQDLQGPKIRFGDLSVKRLDVYRDEELVLAYGVEHQGSTLPVQYNLAKKVTVGESIYLFDGKIKATVIELLDDISIKIRIENDGFLMSRKAINLPDTDFDGDILTEKDLADIEFGADKDIDFVALSFVQSDQDIYNLRQILASHNSSAHVIAKIETKSAIKDDMLERIVKASDGVMVARGDLAVEVGAEVVPIIQRRIISLCRKYGKLSIVATQMLASMVDSPEPTRAEIGDVASAVIQGSDAVMLSDETANGSYPVEAVLAMRKTILYTQDNSEVNYHETLAEKEEYSRRNAISHAAASLAAELDVDIIVAETRHGGTAENIAAMRPTQPILSVTSESRAAQQLALTYANRSFVRPDADEAGFSLAKELVQAGYFGDKQKVTAVIVSGQQPGVSGGTDTIKVRVVE